MFNVQPSQSELNYGKAIRERLDYDASSGALLWRDTGESAIRCYHGVADITVDGIKISASRMVWLWHFGNFPRFKLRHANRASTDTRIENLGFFDKANMIKGAGFDWGVCVPDRWGPYVVARFDSYYTALADCDSVRRAYATLQTMTYSRTGKPKVQNACSPWSNRIFVAQEWEARDLL